MMTLQELQASTINASVAREAYVQADRRLMDLLETKKQIEQKASTLLGVYITISIALFGVTGAIFKTPMTERIWPFFGAAIVFTLGASCFVNALRAKDYGTVGSDPEVWLAKGTIDGIDATVALVLAYIAFDHQGRIDCTYRSNNQKARSLDIGIVLGAVAPIIFFVLFLLLT